MNSPWSDANNIRKLGVNYVMSAIDIFYISIELRWYHGLFVLKRNLKDFFYGGKNNGKFKFRKC